MTSLGRWEGYGPLKAIKALGLCYKKLATRLYTVNIQPKQTALKCAVTTETAAAHHSYKHIRCIYYRVCAMGRFDLASALTIDCHASLSLYGHP